MSSKSWLNNLQNDAVTKEISTIILSVTTGNINIFYVWSNWITMKFCNSANTIKLANGNVVT